MEKTGGEGGDEETSRVGNEGGGEKEIWIAGEDARLGRRG